MRSNASTLSEHGRTNENALLRRVERRRVCRNDGATGLTRTYPKKAARNPLEIMREVLPGEIEEAEWDNLLRPHDGHRRFPGPACRTRRIHQRRAAAIESDTRLDSEPRRDRLADSLDLAEHQVARLGLDRSNGPGESRSLRDNIRRRSRLHSPDRHHAGRRRVEPASNDRLERGDHSAERHDWIAGLVRPRRMRPAANQLDLERIGRRGERT